MSKQNSEKKMMKACKNEDKEMDQNAMKHCFFQSI